MLNYIKFASTINTIKCCSVFSLCSHASANMYQHTLELLDLRTIKNK